MNGFSQNSGVESMTSRKSSNQEPVNDAKGDAKSDKNDLEKALAYVSEMLGDMYSIAVFRKQAPTKHGFPMMRPRWYAPRPYILYRPLCLIVFWQMVCVCGVQTTIAPALSKSFQAVGILMGQGVPDTDQFNAICRQVTESTSNPVTLDYFGFLSTLKRPDINFDRLHARPLHDAPWKEFVAASHESEMNLQAVVECSASGIATHTSMWM